MKRINSFSVTRFSFALGMIMALTIITSTVRADSWDKKTTVTFPQSVEVPGAVLGPGTYVMKLVNLPAERHVVQFTNERENHLFATAMTVSAYREQATDRTVLTFYETPAGQPQALRTWFYPGENDGQEFVYPRGRFSQIAAVPRNSNLSGLGTRSPETNTEAFPAPAPTAAPDPVKELTPAITEEPSSSTAKPDSSARVEIAQATPAKTVEAVVVAQNDAAPPAAELPKTASAAPYFALFGLISMSGAAVARTLRRPARP